MLFFDLWFDDGLAGSARESSVRRLRRRRDLRKKRVLHPPSPRRRRFDIDDRTSAAAMRTRFDAKAVRDAIDDAFRDIFGLD